MSLYDQIRAAGTPRETKEDVVEYYQEKYPKKGMVTNLARDMFPFVRGVKTPHNLERRFNPDRIGNAPRTNQEKIEYAEFGATLPPKPPEGLRIFGWIWVKYSEDCVERYMDETFTGDDVKKMFAMAVDDALQAAINQYQNDDIDSKGPGWCADPDLTVEPIE